VLDVGCGTGWCLAGLAAAGAEPQTLHGVDLDAARVEAARARVAGALIEVGDARSLPYAAHTFGVVLLVVVLSSLQGAPDAVTALREARRVLAPGGVLLVYEPRLPNPLNFRTRVVRDRDLDMAGLVPRTEQSLTLLPQLGRRLGRLTPVLHPTLSRVPALRSHRLVIYRGGPG
jgi:ubiquinone/menaquinone biosynthesis C-methylase UbiE